ncbi:glycerol-3-phosphate phosphatase-like [Coccinella septempunctata]|uniref:glycerol-3-phosphate phosphatase-like n=1 Tax=Coccinella septempunctata TaxID=41139 RepID=UPI001D08B489|nr:glycerol-3-phosphate phosphatase-like [Coccinella septempunctata]
MYSKSVTDLSKLSKDEVKRFLDSFDTVVTDCDGVLWIMGNAIPGSAEVLQKLRDLGKRIFYVTNNSTKTRNEFLDYGRSMNFIINKDEIISSAYLTACYLKSINFQGKVYVVGSEGISQELDEIHIKHIGVGPDPCTSLPDALNFVIDPEVRAVVVGMDKYFSYSKMLKAATYLNNPEVLFIGTNTDERFPASGSKILPGTGSLLRAVECCSLRKATIMGKPSSYVGTVLVNEHKIIPERTLVIGDRCNTDIILGSRCGFKSMLVLTGVTSLPEVQQYKKSEKAEDKELVPDVYLRCLGDLMPFLVE